MPDKIIETLSGLAGLFAKFAPIPLLATALTSTFLLVAPTGWLGFLGLTELLADSRHKFGFAALAGWAYFGALALRVAFRWGLGAAKRLRLDRVRRAALEHLSAHEKGYLTLAQTDGGRTIRVQAEDGVAGSLRAKGVLFLHELGLNYSILEGMPLIVSDWAAQLLTARPDLLAGGVQPGLDGYGVIREPGAGSTQRRRSSLR